MPESSFEPTAQRDNTCSMIPASTARSAGGTWTREIVPAGVCIALGLVMTLLPMAVQWLKIGRFVWIGNGDELFMLALGSQGYFNHPGYLADPVFISGGTSLFRQLPLLPGVWLARALGPGPWGLDFCWRVLGGVSVAATWYVLTRQFVRNRWIAAAISAILLTDCGLLGAGLVFRQVQACARLVAGSVNPSGGEFFHPEWRVASPALTMAYVLLHLWLVSRAGQAPTRLGLALSGISFGLLFHVYPYYWTAAVAALCSGFRDRQQS